MPRPSLGPLPDPENGSDIIAESKSIEVPEQDAVVKELHKPGTRLIMPDEEAGIRNGEQPRRSFDNIVFYPRRKTPKHGESLTYTRIYFNQIAEVNAQSEKGRYPVGSIIVREKLLKEDDAEPELITAMIKREKGFSPKTNDWEFFVIDGKLSKIQKRETKGKCAECHAKAANSDFVFKQYLQIKKTNDD